MPLRENDLQDPPPDPAVVRCPMCGTEAIPRVLPSGRLTCEGCGAGIRPTIPSTPRF
jgi:hypothetical protein